MPSATANPTAVEILSKAKDLMANGHRARFTSWRFHGYSDYTYDFCPLGAIAFARGYDPQRKQEFSAAVYVHSPAVHYLAEAIEQIDPEDERIKFTHTQGLRPDQHEVIVVHSWNDENRDDARVLEAVDLAIELAKQDR